MDSLEKMLRLLPLEHYGGGILFHKHMSLDLLPFLY